jgi:ribonuclease Z
MEILFLGTSSMVPTKERNHSSILISYKNEGLLVDCGEGTQRQLKLAGKKLTSITKILISHWHGDHVLGIPGLIQSMGASDYGKTLQIYGPVGTKKFVNKLFDIFNNNLNVEVTEVKGGKFFENKYFILEGRLLKHSVGVLGYSLVEKDRRRINLKFIKKLKIPHGPILGKLQNGKSIKWKGRKVDVDKATYKIKGIKATIISDTVPCVGASKLAKDSDLLVCESTFSSDLRDKAKKNYHMTSKQAAELAKRSKVKQLILTHFSARYKDVDKLRKDAKKYFNNVECANDFMKIDL